MSVSDLESTHCSSGNLSLNKRREIDHTFCNNEIKLPSHGWVAGIIAADGQ